MIDASPVHQTVQALDVFGGAGRLSECFIDSGIGAVKYELRDADTEDVLSLEVLRVDGPLLVGT